MKRRRVKVDDFEDELIDSPSSAIAFASITVQVSALVTKAVF